MNLETLSAVTSTTTQKTPPPPPPPWGGVTIARGRTISHAPLKLETPPSITAANPKRETITSTSVPTFSKDREIVTTVYYADYFFMIFFSNIRNLRNLISTPPRYGVFNTIIFTVYITIIYLYSIMLYND